MGSNMAEAYPAGFQWVMKVKARGAPLIHIDPRFTPASALADRHVALRAGTDIAFLGGVINYILSNGLEFREYLRNSRSSVPGMLRGWRSIRSHSKENLEL